MVDIEHGTLRAFKDDRLAFGQRAIQQERGVANEGPNLLGSVGIFAKHLVGIKRLRIEERVRDHVFFAARVINMRAEQRQYRADRRLAIRVVPSCLRTPGRCRGK